MRLELKLPPPVDAVLARLEAAGGHTWLVGGVVRDAILGARSTDFDLATSLRPDALQALFPAAAVEYGGLSFVTDGIDFTITTLRADGTYSDGRRPDAIRFVDTPVEDALRRDFTVNAIYLEPRSGEVLDPQSGVEDLRARVIRTIGDPAVRLLEDPLRMLRALRFAGRVDGVLEGATAAVIEARAERIARLSSERVGSELERGFVGAGRGRMLRLLAAHGVGAVVLPEREALAKESWERAAALLDAVPGRPVLAWAACLDGLTPDRARSALIRLRRSSRLVEAVAALLVGVRTVAGFDQLSPLGRDRWLRGREIEDLLTLQAARCQLGHADREPLEQVVQARRTLPAQPLDDLCRGADVLAAGVPPGPAVGEVLAAVRDEIDRRGVSDRDTALAVLASIVESRFS